MPIPRLLCVYLAVSWSHAQGFQCPADRVPFSFSVQVIDTKTGEPIRGLKDTDFEIEGKGVERKVASARADAPAELILVLQERPNVGALAAAARLFVDSLEEADRIAVVSFGRSSRRRLGWSGDIVEIRRAIEGTGSGISPFGAHRLEAAIESLKLFPRESQAQTTVRKRGIVMFAEDLDASSRFTVGQVLPAVIEHRATVYAAVIPPRNGGPGIVLPPPLLVDRIGGQLQPEPQWVSDLVARSGGEVVSTASADFLEQILMRIRARYLLTYCAGKKSSGLVSGVRLSADAAKLHPSVNILYPAIKPEIGIGVRTTNVR